MRLPRDLPEPGGVGRHPAAVEHPGPLWARNAAVLLGFDPIGVPRGPGLVGRHGADLVLGEADGEEQPLDEPGRDRCRDRARRIGEGVASADNRPEVLLRDPQLIAQDVPEEILADLVAEAVVALGLLEPKPADPRRVRRWLERSRSDLALARDVVGRVDRDRAMAIAYEAGDTPPASESQLAMLISDVDDLLDRLARAVEAHPNG